MKIYDLGEKRQRVGTSEGCGCHEPKQAREVAERIAGEITAVRRHPKGAKPVLLTAGKGTKCEPYLTINKDPVKFAACNALADKIGPLNESEKAYQIIEDAIGNEVNEVFGIMTLDLHLRYKNMWTTGRGEPSAVMAPLIPTLQAALIDGAHAVILFHVHPSGIEAEPSDADKDTTEDFAKAFDTVGVILMDHIIAGGDRKKPSFFSFLEAGLL